MGVSIQEYRALLKQQGKATATGPCAGQRMSAAEYQEQLSKGLLTPQTASRPTLNAQAPAIPTKRSESDLSVLEQLPPKKRIAQPEFDSQCALFEWARNPAVVSALPGIHLMSCSLNGVKLTRSQAGKAKAAGMLKGESDVRVPVPRGRWVGLIIEMKAGNNKPTQEQLDYGAAMEAEGHQFHVCYSWEAAREIIECFLKLPKPILSLP